MDTDADSDSDDSPNWLADRLPHGERHNDPRARDSITHYGGHTIAYYRLDLNANRAAWRNAGNDAHRGPHLLPVPDRQRHG